MGAAEFAERLTNVVINPVIALIFAAGLLVFVWGVVEFVAGLSGGSEKTQEGKQHMLWGIIGMFIMVAAYAILKVIANTLKVSLPS